MNSWKDAFRELTRQPGRSLLSLSSVVVAVAAIVAVSSATATTRRAYKEVFQAMVGRADAEIVARGGGRFDQDIADQLRQLEGVESIVPIFHKGTIIYADTKNKAGEQNKAKVLAVGIVPDEPESITGFTLHSGHFPKGNDEVALEEGLAVQLQIKLGDRVRMLTGRGRKACTISGLFALENAARLHQGGMLLAPIAAAQRAFKSTNQVDALHLFLDDPNRAQAVIDEANQILPPEIKAQVPSARSGLAEETLLLTEVSLNMASALSFTTAVFIALSVFLMSVGERRRQLSILRAIGATRRQVIGLVCREALAMGVLGTLAGIPLGVYGGKFLIRSMAAMLQANLPESPDMRWAIGVGAVLGPAICLLAAWYPARRASRVSPLEGIRPVVTLRPHRGHRKTTAIGLLGLVLTSLLGIFAARGDIPIWSAIVGVVFSLVSLALLLPVALPPAVKLIAWPVNKWLGVEGQMSERLVLRHAGRSALTTGVLFIAVAAGVATSNAVFSITDDVRIWYDRTITGDFLLRATMPDMSGQDTASMSEELGEEIAKLPEVQQVDSITLLRIDAEGQEAILVARDFSLYKDPPLDIVNGNLDDVLPRLRAGEVVVGSVLAERAKLRPGDLLHVTYGDKSQTFPVAAITTEYTFGGAIINIDRTVATKLFDVEGVDSYLIKAHPHQAAALEPALQTIAQEHGLLLQSFGEVLRLIDSMVAGVTGGLWVLLILGLLVGGLGVVNTLTMSVLEQTRELGMLRAIGMRRWQVMKTVLGQATLVGLIGVLGGGISGMFLARSINICLASMFGRYVPFSLRPQFVALLLVSGLAIVILSALVPARRAARLNVIQAMRTE
jgi:putative ABC transport system permease protein